MSTQTPKNDYNGPIDLLDSLLKALESPQESLLERVGDEINNNIDSVGDRKEEQRDMMANIHRAIQWREGKVKLTSRQERLLDMIFKGRKRQSLSNVSLGEGLEIVLKCKSDEEVDREMEFWR